MSHTTKPFPPTWSIADLLDDLGNISPARIRLRPAPGKAAEKDLLAIAQREDRLYELVHGVLVEKIMGYTESTVALWLAHLLQSFLDEHDLGVLSGEAGPVRLLPGLVRIPDVAFLSWERLPGRKLPVQPILELVPDLAVEVLSPGNTHKEMQRKLKGYFLAGVRLVWFIDIEKRTVEVFTAPDQAALLTETQTQEGGGVLPGFRLPLKKLFARLPQNETPPTASARKKKGKAS